jgi:hypothetical protein
VTTWATVSFSRRTVLHWVNYLTIFPSQFLQRHENLQFRLQFNYMCSCDVVFHLSIPCSIIIYNFISLLDSTVKMCVLHVMFSIFILSRTFRYCKITQTLIKINTKRSVPMQKTLWNSFVESVRLRASFVLHLVPWILSYGDCFSFFIRNKSNLT